HPWFSRTASSEVRCGPSMIYAQASPSWAAALLICIAESGPLAPFTTAWMAFTRFLRAARVGGETPVISTSAASWGTADCAAWTMASVLFMLAAEESGCRICIASERAAARTSAPCSDLVVDVVLDDVVRFVVVDVLLVDPPPHPTIMAPPRPTTSIDVARSLRTTSLPRPARASRRVAHGHPPETAGPDSRISTIGVTSLTGLVGGSKWFIASGLCWPLLS